MQLIKRAGLFNYCSLLISLKIAQLRRGDDDDWILLLDDCVPLDGLFFLNPDSKFPQIGNLFHLSFVCSNACTDDRSDNILSEKSSYYL